MLVLCTSNNNCVTKANFVFHNVPMNDIKGILLFTANCCRATIVACWDTVVLALWDTYFLYGSLASKVNRELSEL